jgi:hypothetical protein
MDEKTNELEDSYTALSYGLTLEQYYDARRIAGMNLGITQITKLLALSMKYPPHAVVNIDAAVRRMISA